MPLYHSKTLDFSGQLKNWFIWAPSSFDLNLFFHKHDQILLSCTPFKRRPWQRISTLNQALFCDHISTCFKRNLSLQEALRSYIFPSLFGGDLKEAILHSLSLGMSLSHALETIGMLDSFGTYMIKISEKSDILPLCFENLAKIYRTQHNLHKRYQKLLTYPLILSILLFGTFFSFMPLLIDHIQEFLSQSQSPINLHQSLFVRIFYDISWPFIGSFLVTPPLLFYLGNRFRSLAYVGEKIFFHFPILGSLKKSRSLNTFFQILSYQLSVGISLTDAITIQREFFQSLVIQKGLFKTLQGIASGIPFSISLKSNIALPPMVFNQLKQGETTGTLDRAIGQTAILLEKMAYHRIEQCTQYIQPLFLSIIGLFLIWGVSSVLYPLYEGLGNGLR